MSKWWMKRRRESTSLEENAASDDELEAEYQEAVALMTIAKQRRAEADQARQFFRKPQWKVVSPSSTSSSRNSHVLDVGNWVARPK